MSAEYISEEQFEAYEIVRRSGLTNMFDTHMVARLSMRKLNYKEVIRIISNYGKLHATYPNVVCGACKGEAAKQKEAE